MAFTLAQIVERQFRGRCYIRQIAAWIKPEEGLSYRSTR